MWRIIKKILRDLALTLYDHPTEFKCLSWPRLWGTVFGVEMSITWYREMYCNIKFANWMYLTMAFTCCAGAYGWKKYVEGKKEIAGLTLPYNSQEANMKP